MCNDLWSIYRNVLSKFDFIFIFVVYELFIIVNVNKNMIDVIFWVILFFCVINLINNFYYMIIIYLIMFVGLMYVFFFLFEY